MLFFVSIRVVRVIFQPTFPERRLREVLSSAALESGLREVVLELKWTTWSLATAELKA